MKIKIYQVNTERDADGVAFMDLDRTTKHQNSPTINSEVYDKVFEGNVECKNLEDVFSMFNMNHPVGYKARSLSVSDVVEVVEDESVETGFYFCDNFGFQPVQFEPEKAQTSDRFCDAEKVDKITVLMVRAGQYPEVLEIENNLEAMQAAVGGDIEEYMPFEDEVAIVCNEEGKVNGLPLNRAVYEEPQNIQMSYRELKEKFQEAERSGRHKTGYIVFTKDSFTEEYPPESRTYEVSSQNKAFMPNMGGYSIFGSAIDGSDNHVRLDGYMADEKGGKDGWKVQCCYLREDSREILDIIAGDFFLAYAPVDSEKFDLVNIS